MKRVCSRFRKVKKALRCAKFALLKGAKPKCVKTKGLTTLNACLRKHFAVKPKKAAPTTKHKKAPKAEKSARSRVVSAPIRKPFAVQVMEIANSSTGKALFGPDKVFISEVWKRFPSGMTEAEFKRKLWEANRDGSLKLARADLVELMDKATVRASEVDQGGATFHFIRI